MQHRCHFIRFTPNQVIKLSNSLKEIDIILTLIYNDHSGRTDLRACSLNKCILDTCTKTAFSSNNIIYEQKDSVNATGSSFGLVMANIMNELENEIMKPLMNNGTIKFYCKLVDDTVLVSPQDVNCIHNLLNSFDNNLQFFLIGTFHARLNSHCKAWSYKKKKNRKIKSYRKSL